MPFFRKKPPSQLQHQLKEHVLSEDKYQSTVTDNPSGAMENTSRLINFKYQIVSPSEENNVFKIRAESSTYYHNIDKWGFGETFYTPLHLFKVNFEFDTTTLTAVPSITQTQVLIKQNITQGFGTHNTQEYNETKRFKRDIVTMEHAVAGIPLTAFLKPYSDLPSVVEFLKLYEATPKTCSRDILPVAPVLTETLALSP